MDDFIHVRKGLGRTPEVVSLVRASGRTRHEIIGLLVEFWGWVEEESKGSGIVLLGCVPPGITISQFLSDAVGGDPPFWKALREVGWLRIDGKTLVVPHAGRYTQKKASASEQMSLDLADTDAEDLEAGFVEFWKLYPRRENRLAARKSWQKIKPRGDKLKAILAGVRRDAATEQWRRGVVPHASTWLNNRRWEDERSSGNGVSGREAGKSQSYTGLAVKLGGGQASPHEESPGSLLAPGQESNAGGD